MMRATRCWRSFTLRFSKTEFEIITVAIVTSFPADIMCRRASLKCDLIILPRTTSGVTHPVRAFCRKRTNLPTFLLVSPENRSNLFAKIPMVRNISILEFHSRSSLKIHQGRQGETNYQSSAGIRSNLVLQQDNAAPEAESITCSSATTTTSENEESLSSSSSRSTNDNNKAERVETTTTTETAENMTTTSKKKYKPRIKDPHHKYPVNPRVIHLVHRPKTYVNQ
jgi:hypothetical protein